MKRIVLALATLLIGAASPPPPDLTGLWSARLRFGPDIKGDLRLIQGKEGWSADLAGFTVPVRAEGRRLAFALPDGKGSFRGERAGDAILGQWIQEKSVTGGLAYASPLTLRPDGPGRWKGEVRPAQDSFTFYMPVTRRPDGSYSTYLRNPERNQGRFLPVTTLALDGDHILLSGRREGQPADRVIAEGIYDREGDMFSVKLRGATYDFVRDTQATSPFYPRSAAGQPYRYRPPPALDDGWQVGTLQSVGLSQPEIEAFVQWLIDMKMDGVSSSQIHSVLIARHGKLVLEEYFHGQDRNVAHETRSAAKSLTATLIGAAMAKGIPIRLDTPVYRTMYDGHPPADLDPRKKAMKLEDLLTMSGGHFCDDSNPDAPGNEDAMLDQSKEPDYYRFILALPMDRMPGEKSVYCSIDPHLAGGVLARISGEPLPELFRRLVAEPLGMRNYYWPLSPTGDGYMGGGALVTPRDFLKVAQVMVNGGTWNGRRIVSRDWAKRSTSPIRQLAGIQYGYLWWSMEHPFRGRKVRAFFAGGNGGQTFMGIPDLDLVVAFTGGNYADPALFIPQRVLVPKYVLPAVVD